MRTQLSWILGTCVLGLLVATASPARAGTITLSYTPSGYLVESNGTLAWSGGVTGGFTVSVTAVRSTPSASFGFISGGTVSYLQLGVPYGTHLSSMHSLWTVGAGGGLFGGAPGVPPVVLGSLMGGFAGLTSLGSAFTAGGSFSFANIGGPAAPPPNAGVSGVGNDNFAAGGASFTGFFGLAGSGTATGGGAKACFNAYGGAGPCLTYPSFGGGSVTAVGSVPGFSIGGPGSEVARSVAIEPVPEPTTALLLGLGLVGLAASGRRKWARG